MLAVILDCHSLETNELKQIYNRNKIFFLCKSIVAFTWWNTSSILTKRSYFDAINEQEHCNSSPWICLRSLYKFKDGLSKFFIRIWGWMMACKIRKVMLTICRTIKIRVDHWPQCLAVIRSTLFPKSRTVKKFSSINLV